jgi:hypothetical protein
VDALQDMLAEQNAAMATLGLQVKSLQYAVDKQTYIAFINTVSILYMHLSPAWPNPWRHQLPTCQ